MRILYVSHDFLPHHPAGTEIYTWQLAKRIQERGHEVHVFTTEKDIGRPHLRVDRREWDGLPVYELVNNLFYEDFAETWDWPPAVEAFSKVLDELAPDVVHVMHLLYLSIGCVEEAARRGIPIVYTLHDYWLQCARFGQRIHDDGAICEEIDFARCGTCLATLKFAQTAAERRSAKVISKVRAATGLDLGPAARGAMNALKGGERRSAEVPETVDAALAAERTRAMERRDEALRDRLVPRVDRFVAPSRFLRDRFVAWGIPEAQIEHVMYGIELDPYRDFARVPAETTRVGFIGTLAPHKGAHLLLEAWGALPADLRDAGELVVYGPRAHNPGYVASLERRAREVGARMGGGLRREDVAGALAEIDLLVVPSVWFENSPLTIHEARATRTPLAVSDFGGMAELVEPGCDGWRFEVGSAPALGEVLERVLRDPGELTRLTFGGQPVKDMRTSAAEMEARYTELVGLRP